MVKCLRWTNREFDNKKKSRRSKLINKVAKIVYIFFYLFLTAHWKCISILKPLNCSQINESEIMKETVTVLKALKGH